MTNYNNKPIQLVDFDDINRNIINRQSMCAEIIKSFDQANKETETLTISFNPTTKMLITSDGYSKVLPTLNVKNFEDAIRSIDFIVPGTFHVTYDVGFITWESVDVELRGWRWLQALKSSNYFTKQMNNKYCQ